MKKNNRFWIFGLAVVGLISTFSYSCKDIIEEPVKITGTVKDIDGNVYDTLAIGSQVWLVQNLKTTHYRNGVEIMKVTADTIWSSLTTGAYCSYNNEDVNISKYGLLYNSYAVTSADLLAPEGWHVAQDADWTILENYLIENGYNFNDSTSGNYFAKSLAANTDWYQSIKIAAIGNDLTRNNKSGFTALPSGYRSSDGSFHNLGFFGFWWSPLNMIGDTEYFRTLNYNNWNELKASYSKKYGLSVRCVKD